MKLFNKWAFLPLIAVTVLVGCKDENDVYDDGDIRQEIDEMKDNAPHFAITKPESDEDAFFVYKETKTFAIEAEHVSDFEVLTLPTGWSASCDQETKTLSITAPNDASETLDEPLVISITALDEKKNVLVATLDVKLEISVPTVTKGARCSDIVIDPEVLNPQGASFAWYLVGQPVAQSEVAETTKVDATRQLVSSEKVLHFTALQTGDYTFELDVTRGDLVKTITTVVEVESEDVAYKSYINKVYEYLPGVGQFTNTLPVCADGDTAEDLRAKAENDLAKARAGMISLGGFGGYVVFGFDHKVINVAGQCDLRIMGNAFWAAANPNPDGNTRGGSCEPGIVSVSIDANGNGLPDDTWYELAGSEYNKDTTIKNYSITYNKPESDPNPPVEEYISWTDNQGGSGWLPKNVFHKQSYYPNWISGDDYTLTGTKLANNAIDESGKGTYWVLYSYPWGYVDNAPNSDPASCFDLSWAVDSEGHSVQLNHIDFVKVHCALNQLAGWLGETSTEVCGATDLHISGEVVTEEEAKTSYLN